MSIWNKIKSWVGIEEREHYVPQVPLNIDYVHTETKEVSEAVEDVESVVVPVEFTEVPKWEHKVVEEEKREWPDFSKMTKLQIDIWARDELGVNLDRRFKKQHMIEEIELIRNSLEHTNNENDK